MPLSCLGIARVVMSSYYFSALLYTETHIAMHTLSSVDLVYRSHQKIKTSHCMPKGKNSLKRVKESSFVEFHTLIFHLHHYENSLRLSWTFLSTDLPMRKPGGCLLSPWLWCSGRQWSRNSEASLEENWVMSSGCPMHLLQEGWGGKPQACSLWYLP